MFDDLGSELAGSTFSANMGTRLGLALPPLGSTGPEAFRITPLEARKGRVPASQDMRIKQLRIGL